MAMIHVLPIPGLILLLGLGLVIAFLVALSRSGRAGGWILLVLLVLPIFFWVVSYRYKSARAELVHSVVPVFEAAIQASIEDNIFWQDNLEEELIPDTYSSVNRAAFGLGAQLEGTIHEALGRVPTEIRILENSEVSTEVLNRMRDGLKTRFENTKIYFYTPKTPEDTVQEGQVRIVLVVQKEDGPVVKIGDTSYMTVNQKGTLEGKVIVSEGRYYKTVSFDTRMWLWDLDSFRSQTGQSDVWISASDETATSWEEARDQAVGKAAGMLSAQIRNKNQNGMVSTQVTKEDLMQHGLIVDEYSQKLAGMAGPIWRHAVLLDVSPGRLQSLAAAKTEVIRVQRNTWLRLILSLGGMLLLVCVVYAIANAATKGYYSTVLAVTAVTAAVILGLVILNFA